MVGQVCGLPFWLITGEYQRHTQATWRDQKEDRHFGVPKRTTHPTTSEATRGPARARVDPRREGPAEPGARGDLAARGVLPGALG